MISYPKTLHIRGSKGVEDSDQIPLSEIEADLLVVEEKLDGSEIQIRLGQPDVVLHRNNPIRGPEYDLFWPWFYEIRADLESRLGSDKVLFGEWLYAKHTVFYDNLPAFFLAYDVYDLSEEKWLTMADRLSLLDGVDVHHVPVPYSGLVPDHTDVLRDLLSKPSAFKSESLSESFERSLGNSNWHGPRDLNESFDSTDLSALPEGLYLKAERDGETVGWYKFIREEFLRTILDSGTHWKDRTLIANALKS